MRPCFYLIKVGNDIIEQSETLNRLMFDLFLLIVVIEASYRGKHHSHLIV